MPSLIGNKPNQVPSNGDLGTLAFQDSNAVNITGGVVDVSAGTAALPTLGTTGDPNTGVFFPAADTVAVATNGVERLRVDANGNVGVGTTPNAWGGTNKGVEVFNGLGLSSSSSLIAGYSQNAYNDGTNWIYRFTNPASLYLQTTGTHSWRIAPSGTAGAAITFTTAMTLDASGGLQTLNTIGVGNATPSASGAGITFPATQVASANANTLDDYEEGTWTPTSAGTTTSGTGTYAIQVGQYTKIGNVVYFYAFVSWSAHTGTGDLLLSSLPFTAANTTALSPVVNVVGSNLTFLNQLYGGIGGNTTTVAIRTMSTAAATAAVAMDTAATVIVTGFYYV
jgi:hypothetical protein